MSLHCQGKAAEKRKKEKQEKKKEDERKKKGHHEDETNMEYEAAGYGDDPEESWPEEWHDDEHEAQPVTPPAKRSVLGWM